MSYDWVITIINKKRESINVLASLREYLKQQKDSKRKKQKKIELNKQSKEIKEIYEYCFRKPLYFDSSLKLLSYIFAKTNEEIEIRQRYIDYVKDKSDLYNKIPIDLLKIITAIKKVKFENFVVLPRYSFVLKIPFKLAKPYISRDDKEFYIIDNPIKKDKVFGIPMISAGSWKGNLRWTAGKILENARSSDEKIKIRLKLVRLFGHENETERGYFNSLFTNDELSLYERELEKITTRDGLRRGRLHFYPTFFFRIGLEVINPHDRKTKAGKIPIYIECVPEGTCGDFALLYVPFDLMGKPPEIQKAELIEDLNLIFSSLRDMMLIYGFSAKKSSGFGIIKPEFPEQGKLHIKGVLKESTFKNFNELKEIIKEVSDSSIRESS